MTASHMLDMLRPFLWLALAAFVAGFLSYAVLGQSHAAAKPPATVAAYTPIASAPSSNAWNLPKHI